jgi:hypothetical protein
MPSVHRSPSRPLQYGLLAVLALYACGRGPSGFGHGGTDRDDTWLPGDTGTTDTGPDTADDTATDDTAADTADDTGDDTGGADTAEPFTGEGYDRGDVAYNLVAPNQQGAEWRLYQHAGAPVVLVFGYAESYAFQEISGYLPELMREFATYGLTIAVTMFYDPLGYPAAQDDAAAWAAGYGLDTVLYDPESSIQGAWCGGTQVKTYLIDGDMVIRWSNLESTSQAQLRDQIADLVY